MQGLRTGWGCSQAFGGIGVCLEAGSVDLGAVSIWVITKIRGKPEVAKEVWRGVCQGELRLGHREHQHLQSGHPALPGSQQAPNIFYMETCGRNGDLSSDGILVFFICFPKFWPFGKKRHVPGAQWMSDFGSFLRESGFSDFGLDNQFSGLIVYLFRGILARGRSGVRAQISPSSVPPLGAGTSGWNSWLD